MGGGSGTDAAQVTASVADEIRLPVQQTVGFDNIRELPAVPRTVCTKPESVSTPIWAFMPKYLSLPLLALVHLAVLCLVFVQGGGGRCNQRGIHHGTCLQLQPFGLQQRVDRGQNLIGQLVALQ